MLETRAARGRHAVVELRAEVPKHVHRFGLRPPGERLQAYDPNEDGGAPVRTFPLGWMLAPSTAKEMGIQAKDAVEAAVSAADSWLARYAWQSPDDPMGGPPRERSSRLSAGVSVGAQPASQ